MGEGGGRGVFIFFLTVNEGLLVLWCLFGYIYPI